MPHDHEREREREILSYCFDWPTKSSLASLSRSRQANQYCSLSINGNY